MKKFIIAMVLVALPFSVSFGFEATSAVSIGSMSQKGHASELGYSVGADISIFKTGNHWVMKNVTSSFYSDRSSGEIQAVRAMALTQKSVFYGTKADSTMSWDVHVGLGTGLWRFQNTSGEDKTAGAYNFQVGGMYHGFSGDIGVDAIQMDGADMYYTYFGVGISF